MKRRRRIFLVVALCVGGFLSFTILRHITNASIEAIPEESFKNTIGMEMVKLSSGFYVSQYETRQREFREIMGYNPSSAADANRPVETVMASEAFEFCGRLTMLEKERGKHPEGYIYTLPSFAEWKEYVADASLEGSVTPGGFMGRELDAPLPVGSGEMNRLGLWDLRGNVEEYSRETSKHTGANFRFGADFKTHRKDFLRVANKTYSQSPLAASIYVGFRVVLIPTDQSVPCDTLDTALHAAAAVGDTNTVKSLLHNGSPVDSENRWRATPLHRAVIFGHTKIIKILAEAAANVGVRDASGRHPLHYACVTGRVDVAKILLEAGADPTSPDGEGMQPLHLASKHGCSRMAELLISFGADVDGRNDFDWTPLHLAVWYGNFEAVQLLIEAGADVNARGNDWSPLNCANSRGDRKIADLLQSHGAR
jgi:formylglycine-generating enzyme required for sulfatase activity